ncbi:MAG: ketopantoate reductase family protein, partial [Octadecabacter sp.]|nr:ketopantoate reductase family protein [Octadecabacter sp.]
VLLCVKGQDTAGALEDLRGSGVTEQPIFCAQNGIANERAALRMFPNVHGVTVMMPATYITAGEVACMCEPAFGIFDIGRYPGGTDADDGRLIEALEAANIGAFLCEDVMASKRGKLLMNLHNIQKAAVGAKADTERLRVRVRAEAEAVFKAAGLDWAEVDERDTRRAQLMRMVDSLPGVERVGSSTNQSLERGTGRLETDFLNGEIALLARLNGMEAPLNAGLCRVAAELARSGAKPGSMTLDALEAKLG